ncbi:MAG TPA: hypothetical protein VGN85_10860 [Methyloceanibacter sp.]|jgi:hypothetical protein|nr:hypothetical protein [Methyloceanibacter sp.]
MRRKFVTMSVGLAALALASLGLVPANAESEATNHDAAIKACSTVNPSQPVKVVNAVEDGSGLGFSLVWLNDKDGNLWMCDADDGGKVYSYAMVTGDLLDGGGPDMIGLQLASDGTYDGQPQEIAEKVCAAYLTGGGKVLASAPDGFETDPGFVVFVGGDAGKYYLCNATADAAVWAFSPIGHPLTFPEQQS